MGNPESRLSVSDARASLGDSPARDVASARASPDRPADATPVDIDLEALARCVYDLLQREARIERERLGLRR